MFRTVHYVQLVTALLTNACTDSSAPPSGGNPPPPGTLALGLQRVASSLNQPLYLTAPAGDARLFIVEKGGIIKVLKAGAVLATPFLNISAKVSSGGEQGLLGLAFPPQYATNGRFFVSYTNTSGATVIASYVVSANPDVADGGSEAIRLTFARPQANHNGGHLAFGPDGFLYYSSGDGGGSGDPDGNGQDRTDLFGSLLRLDVSAATGYVSPPDNPWISPTDGFRDELWNYGLRNPWRFSFDRSTGDLYIADVGQGAHEEVDVSTAATGRGKGLNYGWSIMEGNSCYNATTCNQTGLTLPVLDYDHSQGCSISGGYVYRGSAIPELQGTYFYSDFCSGWVRSFKYAGGAATEAREWASLKPGGSVPGFGEDAAGELYVLSFNGTVDRIVKN